MSEQHLHSLLGKAISGCKKRLYQKLKDGADLGTAVAQFMDDLQKALAEIVSKT